MKMYNKEIEKLKKRSNIPVIRGETFTGIRGHVIENRKSLSKSRRYLKRELLKELKNEY